MLIIHHAHFTHSQAILEGVRTTTCTDTDTALEEQLRQFISNQLLSMPLSANHLETIECSHLGG